MTFVLTFSFSIQNSYTKENYSLPHMLEMVQHSVQPPVLGCRVLGKFLLVE
jgi:hypothetical protein